jgi:hypothetical protein
MAQHRNALPTCVSYRRPEVSRREIILSSEIESDYRYAKRDHHPPVSSVRRAWRTAGFVR